MTTAYIRGYIKRQEEKQPSKWRPPRHKAPDRQLFFDNETTIATNQNATVGGYLAKERGLVVDVGFYHQSEHYSPEEHQVLLDYCKRTNIRLLTLREFVQKVFLKFVHDQRALCVGFNLPFDTPLLGVDSTYTKGKRFRNGFSIKLTDNPIDPRIKIKARGKQYAMIEFGKSPDNHGKDFYRGRFLDLHTLSLALSGERSISLREAGVRFGAKIVKEEAEEHGTITPEYLDYLTRDVLSTASLYDALMHELQQYGITRAPESIYSQASIGKTILAKMGVSTFKQFETDYANKLLGLVMGAYFGGLSVVACRHQSEDCAVVDVTSMYPSVNTLMNMQSFLLAEKIQIVDATEEVQEFLNTITKEDLQRSETWKHLPGIALLKPDHDPLPFRGQFDPEKADYNIVIAELTSELELPFTIPDLVAAKLRSGKPPKISKAYRFLPVGRQEHLKSVDLLGLHIDPNKDDIFTVLVNERQRIKRELSKRKHEGKDKTSDYLLLKSKESVIKLIINSTGYGIYVEDHPEHDATNVTVHSTTSFESKGAYEALGPYFNPMIGVTVTGAARLFLTLIELVAKEHGSQYLFCDTDSMAIPPRAVKPVQEFFKPLSPYEPNVELIKDETKEYRSVTFIGIAAKRYALYTKKDGEIKIIKSSEHGLGQIMNPFGKTGHWHDQIWTIIIKRLTNELSEEEFEAEYGHLRAVCKLTISNYQQWLQVKQINVGKSYKEQIKPGGFMSRGYGTERENGKVIKPIAPYDKDTQKVARGPFTDAYTGKHYPGDPKYWRRLVDVIDEYQNHKDLKLDGETGYLQTKKITIDRIKTIGKEAKTYVPDGEDHEPATTFHNLQEDKNWILKMTPAEAKKQGVTRSALWKIKQKIRADKKINYKTSAVRKLTL